MMLLLLTENDIRMTNHGEYILISMADFQGLPEMEYGSNYIVSNEGQILLRKDMFQNFQSFKVYDKWAPNWELVPDWVQFIAVDAFSDEPVMYNLEPTLVKDKYIIAHATDESDSIASKYREEGLSQKICKLSIPRIFRKSF